MDPDEILIYHERKESTGKVAKQYVQAHYNKKHLIPLANEHELNADDLDCVRRFRLDKPKWSAFGDKLSPTQLRTKFLQHSMTKPETRKRGLEMPLADFMVMYKSIMKDEDDEGEINIQESWKTGENKIDRAAERAGAGGFGGPGW